MMPRLENHERIFINKFLYRFRPIERGDVVVFRYPLDTSKSYIKRVIGLPGDEVSIQRWPRAGEWQAAHASPMFRPVTSTIRSYAAGAR